MSTQPSRFVSVNETYIRVNISTDIERERYRPALHIEDALKRQRVGEFADSARFLNGMTPLESIETSTFGFALIGTPGSGKTTIFRYLAVESARGREIRGKKRIPIYLAARDLAINNQGIINAAEELFKGLGVNEAALVVQLLLKSGNCLILLDGIDETNTAHQTSLLNELLDINARFPKSLLCVSSRPSNLSVGLPNFTKWETLPLSFQDRLLFVRKWFSLVDPSKGERLIEKCKDRPEMLDLGANPLLLSIVCALFHNDLDIPSEPDELYERAVYGLLGGWDVFRNIARKSTISDMPIRKRIVLVSWLAAYLFQEGKVAFSPANVNATQCLRQVAEVLQIPPLDANELLATLYNDFGLLVERSPNLFSFSHLTIHEYLVARYIVDNRQEMSLLLTYISDPKWEDIIRLVGKMLPNADQFMIHLQSNTNLEKLREVMLLESVWLSKPICSSEVRRKLVTQIAQKIAGVAKRFRSFRVIDTTLLIQSLSKEPRGIKGNSKRSAKYFFPPLIKICFPNLLRIIKVSGFTYHELGVGGSPIFQSLLQAKTFEIDNVWFLGEEHYPREEIIS